MEAVFSRIILFPGLAYSLKLPGYPINVLIDTNPAFQDQPGSARNCHLTQQNFKWIKMAPSCIFPLQHS